MKTLQPFSKRIPSREQLSFVIKMDSVFKKWLASDKQENKKVLKKIKGQLQVIEDRVQSADQELQAGDGEEPTPSTSNEPEPSTSKQINSDTKRFR